MLERLDHFLSTISDLFDAMLRRLPLDYINWIQPGQGLSWIIYAARPLMSSEFAVAVEFDQISATAPLEFDKCLDKISSDLPGDVNRITGSWVKVHDGRVWFADAVLKDAFRAQHKEDRSDIETRLLLKCLRYLVWVDSHTQNDESGKKRCELRDSENSTELHLLSYASVYWPYHFQRAAPVPSDVLQEVLAFLENKLQFWSFLLRKYRTKPLSLHAFESPLKISASLGLTQVVDGLLSQIEKPVSEENENLIQEAMMLTVEHGHSGIALRLYEMQSSCTIPQLHKAAAGGFDNVLSAFLAFDSVKASVNGYDNAGYTPLHYAAQYGHLSTVKLLLGNGASAKLTSDDGTETTALHIAVRVSNLYISELLIGRGADARARDSAGYNAVAIAAEGGFEDLIWFFMFHEEDAQMVQESVRGGDMPLHLAARYGHTSACRCLLQLQADIKAVNANHETPLHLAVRGGFSGTVEFLLKNDKVTQALTEKTQQVRDDEDNGEAVALYETPSRDESQRSSASPLQIVAELGYTDIIRLLLTYENYAIFDDIDQSLRLAAADGHAECVKVLVDKTRAIDPVDAEGNTALHLAGSHGHAEVVSILLDSAKISKDLPNEGRMTAIHLAAREGQAQAVMAMLEHGCAAEMRTANGDTPMHVAAAKGNVNVLEVLCAEKPSIGNIKNHDDETPLILAAKRGLVAVVKQLLHVPGSMSTSKETGGESLSEVWGGFYPLHTAALEGHDELVRFLVTEEGYDINIRRNTHQQTPLHIAVQSKSATMITLLMDLGADVAAADEDKDTALHIAVMNNLEACRALLSHISGSGVKAINLPGGDGESPLHQACAWGNVEIVRLLVDKGADCHMRNTEGWTPLHTAASWGQSSVVTLLLDKGADYRALTDSKSTPIILAAENGSAETIAVLIEAGAAADAVNSEGATALHGTAQAGHLDCVELLVEKCHVDYNLSMEYGRTPLHLAAGKGHVKVVKYLLEKGAQVRARSEIFGTPLDSAMRNGQIDVVELLVENGLTTTVDLSLTKSWGNNVKLLEFALGRPLSFKLDISVHALQQAITSSDDRLISFLIEKIPDVNEECEPYKTVLQAAASTGDLTVLEKLLVMGADPNIKGGKFGSALHAAIIDRNPRSVKLLLQHDADPAAEHEGQGAIFIALRLGNLEVITALLENMDSTARAAKDTEGRSLLACAIKLRNQTLADQLVSMEDVSIYDKDVGGRTPLMEAVLRNNAYIVKKLLERGADPNARDTEGKTPLIRAIFSPDTDGEIVTALLEHPDLDPALKDCRGRAYAYWAARLGCVRDAIESNVSESVKARINQRLSSNQNLALHAAFASGEDSVVMATIRDTESEDDWIELDGDDWTASYTATRYKVKNMKFAANILTPFGPGRRQPQKWHREDKSPCLHVSDDGRVVTVMSKLLCGIIGFFSPHPACAVGTLSSKPQRPSSYQSNG